jgi:Lrp/AsnC family transcriptional regulator for asnA, asnC and gidA
LGQIKLLTSSRLDQLLRGQRRVPPSAPPGIDEPGPRRCYGFDVTPYELDALDTEIVRELQEDGRRPFRQIGRTLDVPEATVRTRVRRLQQAGVLQILAFADPTKMNNATLALLLLEVDPESHEDVVAILEQWTQVTYVSTTIGIADICVQVMSQSNDDLLGLTRQVRMLPGVFGLHVLTEVKMHKLRFALPPFGEASDGAA